MTCLFLFLSRWPNILKVRGIKWRGGPWYWERQFSLFLQQKQNARRVPVRVHIFYANSTWNHFLSNRLIFNQGEILTHSTPTERRRFLLSYLLFVVFKKQWLPIFYLFLSLEYHGFQYYSKGFLKKNYILLILTYNRPVATLYDFKDLRGAWTIYLVWCTDCPTVLINNAEFCQFISAKSDGYINKGVTMEPRGKNSNLRHIKKIK